MVSSNVNVDPSNITPSNNVNITPSNIDNISVNNINDPNIINNYSIINNTNPVIIINPNNNNTSVIDINNDIIGNDNITPVISDNTATQCYLHLHAGAAISSLQVVVVTTLWLQPPSGGSNRSVAYIASKWSP